MIERLVPCALLLACVPGAAAAGNRNDTAEIIRAVVAQESRLQSVFPAVTSLCAKAVTDGISFERLRWERRFVTRVRLGPDHKLFRRDAEESLWLRGWSLLFSKDRPKIVKVQAADASALSRAAASIVARKPREKQIRIDAAMLTFPYRLCDPGRDTPALELTAPAVRGDLAFVEAQYEWSHGITYALRRNGQRWEVIAEIWRWVS